MASKMVRPGQVYRVNVNIFQTMFPITVRASIQRDGVELATAIQEVKQNIPETLLLKMILCVAELLKDRRRAKITDVAREFDIAHSVVSRLWKSFKTTGMCRDRTGRSLEVRRLQKTDISSYQQKRNRRTTAQQDCLDSEGIQRLVWPARSPDLNPIENVGMLWGGKLVVETILRQTRTPLIRALTEGWDKWSQQLLDNVVQSMVPTTSVPGSYNLRVEGNVNGVLGGTAFINETKLTFSQRSMTIFVQTDRPVYKQGQTDNLVALHFKYDQARRRFVEWAQNEIAVVPDFHKRILFSDEAHFWLNGYVNKQNCRIWSEANPQVYVETPLHPEKLTVWCALWAGGTIGPYFFKTMKATPLQSMVIGIEP
ncbi:CD109 antigen [Trichonephila clavipes]|nr:CD109 antigen [Trichonephila clavipes]